jgi:hypothetical protein
MFMLMVAMEEKAEIANMAQEATEEKAATVPLLKEAMEEMGVIVNMVRVGKVAMGATAPLGVAKADLVVRGLKEMEKTGKMEKRNNRESKI